jgi:hypothetical protein
MNSLTRGILLAGAGSLVASFGVAAPAHAQANTPTCHGQQLEWLEVRQPTNKLMTSDLTLVANGSPCRDINIKTVHNVDGKATCSTIRVNWVTAHKTSRWKRVCKGWTVLAKNAPEGEVFVIEAKGRPVDVAVRS